MWQQGPKNKEFRVVTPTLNKGLREHTAVRLLQTDEFQNRHHFAREECADRLSIVNSVLLLPIQSSIKLFHHPALRPEDEWDHRTRVAFENAEHTHLQAASKQYSPYCTHWMPHDQFRRLHAEWRLFYEKWKAVESEHAASSLLSSFFCGILVDKNLEPDDAVMISREIMESCLEVTNDAVDEAFDAVPYHTFMMLIQSISMLLFPHKHAYIAVHLLAAVLQDRSHRVQ